MAEPADTGGQKLGLILTGGGARAAYLEVRASNGVALALYARFGFREVGRRRGYYRRPVEDAVVMRAPLGAAGEPA